MLPNVTITKATLLIFLTIVLISIKPLPQFHKSSPETSQPNMADRINSSEIPHTTKNQDGSITRLAEYYPTVPSSTTNDSCPSLSRDMVVNPEKNTFVRIYLPRSKIDTSETTESHPMSSKKLPVIVFVHGGGFLGGSVGTPEVHEFCSNAASQLAALVISVEYRLAPEHRLPAAYEDALEALSWVKESKDEWIIEYGDLSRCVLMGESAGGNIAYHVGLKVADKIHEFRPLNISGLVLIQPFFGGVNRTESELRLADDPVLPLEITDFMWNSALPVGANRSHEYCDPFVGSGSKLLDRVRDLGWWVGVTGCDGDPLYDRNVMLVELMKDKGLNVRSLFDKGGSHGMFVGQPTKMKELFLWLEDDFWIGRITKLELHSSSE